MPITEFQKNILRQLSKHRNPNSYVAGGIAINRSPNSLRRSNDIDFFQDSDELVQANAEADQETLIELGYN